MVLNRMYGEGKLRGDWLTQVHLEGWPLNRRVYGVCIIIIIIILNPRKNEGGKN